MASGSTIRPLVGRDTSNPASNAHLQGEDCLGRSSSNSLPGPPSSKEPFAGRTTRIDLAPDQPLTVDGKPRARVYIACQGCRIRKVRCDGAKPVCYNCQQRDSTITACHYDETPIRRGQDKVFGSRIRSSKGTRKARTSLKEPESLGISQSGSPEHHNITIHDTRPQIMVSFFDPMSFRTTRSQAEVSAFPQPSRDPPEQETDEDTAGSLVSEPSMQFTRETWWDSLLVFYAVEADGRVSQVTSLTSEQRSTSTLRILADVRSHFRSAAYWGSFIHVPRFFETLLNPTRRSSIQPGLVLGMLAIGTFVQSSELGRGAIGRSRALKLIDQAHAAIQASLSAHWIDLGLIQAAWLLAFFEMQAHPVQCAERNRSAFFLLDSLIRLASLTSLDADLPGAQYSLFAMHTGAEAPAADVHHEPNPTRLTSDHIYAAFATDPAASASAGCSCAQFTLKQQWPGVVEVAPMWDATTMWPMHATEGELRREECRRLVWSSVMLAAGASSYTSASAEGEHVDLLIKHYDNFALLLPGEALARSGVPVSRNDIWALYLRAMLLWHTGLRMRSGHAMPNLTHAQFAIDVWLEADAIEDALSMHMCNLEGRLACQAREFIFNARMCISLDFQRYLPHVSSDGSSLLYREKCESWLRGQVVITNYLWNCLRTDPASELGTRSIVVFWLMGHVTRALVLWENDRSMTLALEAAKAFVLPLECLMEIWPSPTQQQTWQRMRYTLVETCLKAGVAPPTPALPPRLRQSGLRPSENGPPIGYSTPAPSMFCAYLDQ